MDGGKLFVLTAYVIVAADTHFTLGVVELPELGAIARHVDDVSGAVIAAAAEHTGLPAGAFTVDITC